MSGVLFLGCQKPEEKADTKQENKNETKKVEAVPVEMASVGLGDIEAVIQSTANLEAEENVKVYARTTNPVIELLVEEGDLVKKGQVLVRLENRVQKIQVEKSQAQLEKAKRDYERQKELFAKEFITQQVFNDADHELKQAELNLRNARLDLEYTEVIAPISGTVTARLVNLGDQVNVNQHLFDIVDFNSLVARVYLPEKNLASLHVGQVVRLGSASFPGKAFAGSVLRIAPTVDSSTGTVKVTIKVEDTSVLRPGMFVDVVLVLDVHTGVVLIPKRALVYDSDQIFVFRILPGDEEETQVERLLVNPVLSDKFNVEPGGQLRQGDRIVIAGQTGLKDKALVKVLTQADLDPASLKKPTDAEVVSQ